jgi:anti-sigma factor RsiW
MAMIEDLDRKVIDRFLATPVSRVSLVLSQVVRAGMIASIQTVIILGIAWLLGARVERGSVGWLVRGASASSPSFQTFALDALDAHRTYVVEVRHPVEVAGNERAHLQQWLSKRVGYSIKAPDLDSSGLKLVGGRLLPGPDTPAAFFMYETASGERFTLYTSRAKAETTSMRYAEQDKDGAMFWADKGVGYVVSGPTDKDRLNQVARQIYDQTEKVGG